MRFSFVKYSVAENLTFPLLQDSLTSVSLSEKAETSLDLMTTEAPTSLAAVMAVETLDFDQAFLKSVGDVMTSVLGKY
jgi:hypothetical protein